MASVRAVFSVVKWFFVISLFGVSIYLSIVKHLVWDMSLVSSRTELVSATQAPFPAVTICLPAYKDPRVITNIFKTSPNIKTYLKEVIWKNKVLKLELAGYFMMLGSEREGHLEIPVENVPSLTCFVLDKREDPLVLEQVLAVLMEQFLEDDFSFQKDPLFQMEDIVRDLFPASMFACNLNLAQMAHVTEGDKVTGTVRDRLKQFLSALKYLQNGLTLDFLLDFLYQNQDPSWWKHLVSLHKNATHPDIKEFSLELSWDLLTYSGKNVNQHEDLKTAIDNVQLCGRYCSFDHGYYDPEIQDQLIQSWTNIYKDAKHTIPLCSYSALRSKTLQECHLIKHSPNLDAKLPGQQCYSFNNNHSSSPIYTSNVGHSHGLSFVVKFPLKRAILDLYIHNRGTHPTQNFMFGERVSLQIGAEYNVGIGVLDIKVTDEVKALSLEDRDCNLPEDLDQPFDHLGVNFQGAYLITSIMSAIQNCSCVPWHLPQDFFKRTFLATCDIRGQMCFNSQNISQKAVELRDKVRLPCEEWFYSASIDRKLDHGNRYKGYSKINVNFGKSIAHRITSDKSTKDVEMLGTVGGIFNMMHGLSFASMIAYGLSKLMTKLSSKQKEA